MNKRSLKSFGMFFLLNTLFVIMMIVLFMLFYVKLPSVVFFMFLWFGCGLLYIWMSRFLVVRKFLRSVKRHLAWPKP